MKKCRFKTKKEELDHITNILVSQKNVYIMNVILTPDYEKSILDENYDVYYIVYNPSNAKISNLPSLLVKYSRTTGTIKRYEFHLGPSRIVQIQRYRDKIFVLWHDFCLEKPVANLKMRNVKLTILNRNLNLIKNKLLLENESNEKRYDGSLEINKIIRSKAVFIRYLCSDVSNISLNYIFYFGVNNLVKMPKDFKIFGRLCFIARHYDKERIYFLYQTDSRVFVTQIAPLNDAIPLLLTQSLNNPDKADCSMTILFPNKDFLATKVRIYLATLQFTLWFDS